MRPDVETLKQFFARARRRVRILGVLAGTAIGLLVAAGIVVFGAGANWLPVVAAGFVVAGAAAGALVAPASLVQVARLIETRSPSSRNLILTASELIDARISAVPHVTERVYRDASTLASGLDLRAILPAKRQVAGAVAAAGILAATALISARIGPGSVVAGPSSARAAAIESVTIHVTPPAYTAESARILRNPARIETLAGSVIVVTIDADAAGVSLETLGGAQPAALTSLRTFTARVVADTDGFIALAPVASDGTAGVRRLIGLTVTPDRLPNVKLTAPGRDLFVPHGHQTLPLVVQADDDLGLASLTVTFTRIAGSGETFTFSTGDVPLSIARASERAWTGRADWRLEALQLQPGDMVVYRAVATDRRPGAAAAESEAFIVEVTAPGALPSEGFAVDDRQDKYAISQQMVIAKTERLLAERASLPPADFRERALDLAAEQRQVRAEFVFMMGGELADAGLDLSTLNEEVEAAGEDDLAAGRLANQGRMDLIRAIRSMSRAAARLADADAIAALPVEKEALAFLQRAFSRSRYILRALTERERIDLSRRLTGVLAALSRDGRPVAAADPPPHVIEIRRVLADVAALAGDVSSGAETVATRASILAQRVLRIDPASADLRDVAQALTAAAAVAGSQRAAAISAALDRAAVVLGTRARLALPFDPARPSVPGLDVLSGAMADALRRQESRR